MWVFTTGGFVSAVQQHDDPTSVSVRSRDRDSLQCVLDGVQTVVGDNPPPIRFDEGSDYPYRLTVSKEAFATWLAFEVVEYINYTNFKNAVKKSRGEAWSSALLKVWASMISVTDAAARSVGILAPLPTDYRDSLDYHRGTGSGYRKKKKKRKKNADAYVVEDGSDMWADAWRDLM